MKFIVVERIKSFPPSPERNVCYLRIDNWNDYSFQTLFDLHYVDDEGKEISIGPVKIMEKGQTTEKRVQFADTSFKKLNKRYCSLGQGQGYYEELMTLPHNVRTEILVALRDCVENPAIYQEFREERAMRTSLLRGIRAKDVETTFRNILLGNAAPTEFHFQFLLTASEDCKIDINVVPHSTPPTNVHVLIGRNGVGKTRLLSGIADNLTGNKDAKNSMSLQGDIIFPNESDDEGRFTNLITVVFSAFDQFTPIQSKYVKGDIRYQYVGLKKFLTKDADIEKDTDPAKVRFKSLTNLKNEFLDSLEICLTSQRQQRWVSAIQILNSDPIFAEYELDELAPLPDAADKMGIIFTKLSSGHKIILLSITKLVELVDERTLVLIDEPETHLHPPLLASFTRALSDLLIKRNGVALIATHSPVILQEVPASCVTIVDRVRSEFTFERPTIETFAENVGTLTREVFNLEVLESGFHKMIKHHLRNGDFDDLVTDFKNQIGSEGKAIARSLQITKEERDA